MNEYRRIIENMNTKKLIKRYDHMNTDAKRYARVELRERGVPTKQLPFRKKVTTRTRKVNIWNPNFRFPG